MKSVSEGAGRMIALLIVCDSTVHISAMSRFLSTLLYAFG